MLRPNRCLALRQAAACLALSIALNAGANDCSETPSTIPDRSAAAADGPAAHLGYAGSARFAVINGAELIWAYTPLRHQPTLVVIHREDSNNNVAGITTPAGEPSQFGGAFEAAVRERLSCLRPPPRSVYARHYVQGYSTGANLASQSAPEVDAPLFDSSWRQDRRTGELTVQLHGGMGTFSVADHCVKARFHGNPSAAEVAEHCPGVQLADAPSIAASSRAASGTPALPTFNEEKRNELRREQQQANAERYGYVLRDREFWRRVTGYNGTSEIELIHDGRLDEIIGGTSLSLHFLIAIERFGNQCRDRLNPSHASRVITEVETTSDQYGVEVAPAKVSRRRVYYDTEYSDALTTHFDKTWTSESSKPDGAETMGQFYAMMSNPSQALSPYKGISEVLLRPSRHVGGLFNALGCDDPSLEQLRINLLRASQSEPSVQASRQSAYGKQSANQQVSTRQVYAATTPHATVRYGYADSTPGWLPPAPEELLRQAINDAGPVLPDRDAWADSPTQVEVDVLDPAAHSLKTMGVTSWRRSKSPALRAIRDAFWKSGEKSPRSITDKVIVTCDYVGGHNVLFWLEPLTTEELSGVQANHPARAIKANRSHCPATAR